MKLDLDDELPLLLVGCLYVYGKLIQSRKALVSDLKVNSSVTFQKSFHIFTCLPMMTTKTSACQDLLPVLTSFFNHTAFYVECNERFHCLKSFFLKQDKTVITFTNCCNCCSALSTDGLFQTFFLNAIF